jgi:hypothetical protein
MNHIITVLQSLKRDNEDIDLQLPDGINIPMTSVDDMQATEAALADKQFRKIW